MSGINTGCTSMSGAGGGIVCQGRLTLTTAVPVTTADVTGATTIYFTPYHGNYVSLYTNSAWVTSTFTERSLALGTLTSGKNYDVFLYDNSGTLTLELSAAWTNDTARADALALQDGVYVKSADHSRRYLGTFRTTSTTTTEDSYAKRLVWNAEVSRRVARPMRVIDTTDTWSYTTAAFRQANANTANQLAIVVGLAEDAIDVRINATAVSSNGNLRVAVGEDSTTAMSGLPGLFDATLNIGSRSAMFSGIPAIGYHFYTWLEYGAPTAATFHGDNGAATLMQSGIQAMWRA